MTDIDNDIQDNEFLNELQQEDDFLNKLADKLSNEDKDSEEEIEPETETEPEPAPKQEESLDDILVKIKLNGEEREVPLSELKNGYQRQADYTQKTQELSQERQVIEQQKAQWEQYVSSIPVLANVAQQNAQQAHERLYSPEMIKLAQDDPAEYVAQKAVLENTIMTNQQSLESMQHHWEQHQYELNAQATSYKEQEFAKTNEIFTKEYGEDWTSGKIYKELINYGEKVGFSKQDIDGLSNYHIISTLNKARMYDELASKQSTLQKKVDKIPPKQTNLTNDAKGDETEDFKTRKMKAAKKMYNGDDSDFIELLSGMI